MRAKSNKKEIQFSERVSVGIISFMAAALRALFFGLVTLLFGPPITVASTRFFVMCSLVFSFVAAVAGAVVGANKAANLFGIIWDTTNASENQTVVFLGVIILVCSVAIYFTVS